MVAVKTLTNDEGELKMNQNLKVKVYCVQVARGSASRWAWGCSRLIACVGKNTIISATGRLLSWKSGNWSSQAARSVDSFHSRWDGTEVSVAEAIELAEGRVHAPRGIRFLRELLRSSPIKETRSFSGVDANFVSAT
jgi:hypothetical protein